MFRINRASAIVFLTVSLFATCQQEEVTPRAYPRVSIQEVSEVNELGATFTGEITHAGNSEIIDHGFVWGLTTSPTIRVSDNVSLGVQVGTGIFSSSISSTLIEGETYHVKAYARNSETTVYSPSVSFVSLGSKGPEIIDFSPKTGFWGDTIKIVGKNFSAKTESASILFGAIKSRTLSSTDSLLYTVVPDEPNELSVSLKVTIANKSDSSNSKFTYNTPSFTSFSPKVGTFNSAITISGSNIHPNKQYTSVKFGNIEAEVLEIDNNKIVVTVPEELDISTPVISINSVGTSFRFDQPFELNPPSISSLLPLIATRPEEVITIKGSNFNPIAEYNVVKFGDYQADILEVASNQLKVILPNQIIPNSIISVDTAIDVSVEISQTATTFNDYEINWESIWTKTSDFLGGARSSAVSFVINGKGYLGTGVEGTNYNNGLKDFWEYDPKTDQWTQKADIGGVGRYDAVGFAIGDKGYIGLGRDKSDINVKLGDLWMYDPSANIWTQKNDFAGPGRTQAVAFSIDGLGYVGTGRSGQILLKDFWQYNPDSDSWIRKSDFGGLERSDAVGFSILDKGYIGTGRRSKDFWEYNPATDQWSKKADLPGNGITHATGFALSRFGYVGLGSDGHYNSTIYQFDPSSNTWAQVPTFYQLVRSTGMAITIDQCAYITTGNSLPTVWKFNASKF